MDQLWREIQQDQRSKRYRWGQAMMNRLSAHGIDTSGIIKTARDPFFVVDDPRMLMAWASNNLEFDATGRFVMGVRNVQAEEA